MPTKKVQRMNYRIWQLGQFLKLTIDMFTSKIHRNGEAIHMQGETSEAVSLSLNPILGFHGGV